MAVLHFPKTLYCFVFSQLPISYIIFSIFYILRECIIALLYCEPLYIKRKVKMSQRTFTNQINVAFKKTIYNLWFIIFLWKLFLHNQFLYLINTLNLGYFVYPSYNVLQIHHWFLGNRKNYISQHQRFQVFQFV